MNFFCGQLLLEEKFLQSTVMMVLCFLVLTHVISPWKVRLELFESLANQPTMNVSYHENLQSKFHHTVRVLTQCSQTFRRVIYGYGDIQRCSAHLSHIDACSDVPLGMTVTQLCHSSYWIESCILCKCGWDHF